MNVTYSEPIMKSGAESMLLQQATKQLEEVLGEWVGEVSAAWDRSQDARGRLLYTLELSGFSHKASANFTPEDLRSAQLVHKRCRHLWEDLLQVYSKARTKELLQLSKEW